MVIFKISSDLLFNTLFNTLFIPNLFCKMPSLNIFLSWWNQVAFIDNYTHLKKIVRHQLRSLIQIQCNAAIFYGILQRISPVTFLQLKIQLERDRFEPQTFQVPV